jgi:hypothetical protein
VAVSNSPERWRQAEALFHQAMNCDPAQRADFLADACGNDQALPAVGETAYSATTATTMRS